MIITHKLKPMDLAQKQSTGRVDVVQGDKYSRNIEFTFMYNGVAWQIPDGTTAIVRYKKPDAIGGNYDTLPDGSTAYQINGNVLTVCLAPQVCTVPGVAQLSVGLIQGSAEINTFSINIVVQPNPGAIYQSEDYIRLSGAVPNSGWPPNMYLGTDAFGNVIAKEGTGAVHADIPEYIKAAALEVAKKVRAVQTDESITFIAMSDSHQLDTSEDIVTGNKHAGMAANALAYIMPNIDFACFLGDYTAGSNTTTIEEGKRHFAEINADIDEAFAGIPQFRTVGNHDPLGYSYSQNGDYLDQATLYDLVGKYNDDGITVMGSTTGGYCYRDFTDKKVRVICLNTAEMTSASSGSAENMTGEQKLWFANALKSAGAKGSDWGIIVLSHHPLDWGNILMASNIVHAYVEGGSITVTSGNTVNFSGSNSAKFLGAFHGHVHCFKTAKLNYIANSVGTEYQAYRIAVPNMCFSRNNEYGQNNKAEYYGIEFGEDTTYNKTAGTANDTAFVVNVVNPSEEKIYSFCYGAGYDREVFTGTQTVAVTGVSLNASSGALTVNGQTTLTATVEPSNATNKTVTWTSSAPTVATVVNGVVTALSAGTAVITARTQDGGFTATYSLTVKAATVDVIATYGYADDTRLSTSNGGEKTEAGYVTIGHTAPIPVDKTTYPNGATIRVTGADDVVGNSSPYTDSAWVIYTDTGSTYLTASYIKSGSAVAGGVTLGTFTIDDDRTGFTLDLAELTSPKYLKFCVKGTGANLTATLTPK